MVHPLFSHFSTDLKNPKSNNDECIAVPEVRTDLDTQKAGYSHAPTLSLTISFPGHKTVTRKKIESPSEQSRDKARRERLININTSCVHCTRLHKPPNLFLKPSEAKDHTTAPESKASRANQVSSLRQPRTFRPPHADLLPPPDSPPPPKEKCAAFSPGHHGAPVRVKKKELKEDNPGTRRV